MTLQNSQELASQVNFARSCALYFVNTKSFPRIHSSLDFTFFFVLTAVSSSVLEIPTALSWSDNSSSSYFLLHCISLEMISSSGDISAKTRCPVTFIEKRYSPCAWFIYFLSSLQWLDQRLSHAGEGIMFLWKIVLPLVQSVGWVFFLNWMCSKLIKAENKKIILISL